MPHVLSINLSYESIGSLMAKLRADKASGPDSVAPKLLKFTDGSIIPSLLSVFNISATCNTVPATMKVTMKLISRKSMVALAITTHVTGQGLGNHHQWAYWKGHSTKLLLVKITDDWRQARCCRRVYNAFDAIPTSFCSENCGVLV